MPKLYKCQNCVEICARPRGQTGLPETDFCFSCFQARVQVWPALEWAGGSASAVFVIWDSQNHHICLLFFKFNRRRRMVQNHEIFVVYIYGFNCLLQQIELQFVSHSDDIDQDWNRRVLGRLPYDGGNFCGRTTVNQLRWWIQFFSIYLIFLLYNHV